jgi:hypothetical protein
MSDELTLKLINTTTILLHFSVKQMLIAQGAAPIQVLCSEDE